MYERLGKHAEALGDYDEAISLDNTLAETHLARCARLRLTQQMLCTYCLLGWEDQIYVHCPVSSWDWAVIGNMYLMPRVRHAEAAFWSAWGMHHPHVRILKPHVGWSPLMRSSPLAWACTTATTAVGPRRWQSLTGHCSWTPHVALSTPTEGELLHLKGHRRVWSRSWSHTFMDGEHVAGSSAMHTSHRQLRSYEGFSMRLHCGAAKGRGERCSSHHVCHLPSQAWLLCMGHLVRDGCCYTCVASSNWLIVQLLWCSYVNRKLNDYEGAARDYNEALQRGECNVRTYTNFAFCLAKLGYYAEAVRAYDSVLELDPANENALHNRWAEGPPCSAHNARQQQEECLGLSCLTPMPSRCKHLEGHQRA